jgi:hypothetical protein
MAPADVDPPVRPDLHASWTRPERRWWPLVGVVALIAVVVLGGFVTSSALSEAAGPPVEIPGIVQVRPLTGWEESAAGPVPLSIEGRRAPGQFVQLTRGNGNVAIVAVRVGSVSPQALAQAFALGELEEELDRPTVSRNLEDVVLESGARAVRFAYVGVVAETGVSIEGEVTVLVTTAGDGVIFDAFASEGLLQFILGDVHAMEDDAGFFA